VTRYGVPEILGDDHVIEGFDCGDAVLNDWLARRALSNQRSGASRTWVITGDERRVVAFYASSTAVVLRAHATKRVARNQPEPIPALLLGRLAVDRKHQGRGLAVALLKHFLLKALEVAEVTGLRVLLVHAANADAASFYRQYGFEPSPVDDLTLMLLIHDVTGGSTS
jgi:GNAT superfamily N-acetyltransferase